MYKRLNYNFYVTFCLIVSLSSVTTSVLHAQSPYIQLSTATNLVVADTVAGQNLAINFVNPLAQHGTVDVSLIQSGGAGVPHIYKVAYLPDPGFVGIDTFVLEYNYFGSYPFLVYRAFRVSVNPTLVLVKQDFATTGAGTPVLIPVLANDQSSAGALTLTDISGVNHGSAVLSGGGVLFTPEPGFEGSAHFTYTACDPAGNCKNGSASIGVHVGSAPVNDSLFVFTAKNTALSVPLPFTGYTIFQAPAQGTVALLGGQNFRYTPNFNYTGADQFVLVNNSFGAPVYKTIAVTSLNTPVSNTMAMEDVKYTPKGQAITFNVRSNDIGNLLVRGWTIPSNLPGTVSGTNGIGNVTFTPNANFTGVATFYYKLGNANVPDLEIGKVQVVVGNLPPSASTYDFTTPQSTPIVVHYEIPFSAFNFSIADAPDHGVCTYFPGFTTQTINGQPVSGNNLLVYTPAQGYIGLDEFEINYCTPSNGTCYLTKITANVTQVVSAPGPYCIGDQCVWPGDANNDGIVNNKDILALGYTMGLVGNSRTNGSLEWYGQSASNWGNPFTDHRKDLKYVDADGDGLITTIDTLPIHLFYGQEHQLRPTIAATDKGLPFFIEFTSPPNPSVGDRVVGVVSLGNANYPVTNLYGFTFDLRLSPQLVDSAFRMQYYPNTWLNLNAPYLTLDKRPTTGKLETAFTRTNGNAVNGYGVIGAFDFVIIDILDGGKPGSANYAPRTYPIQINTSIMNGDGETEEGMVTLNLPIGSRNNENIVANTQDLLVFPSPAQNSLQLHLNGTDLIQQAIVRDLTGKTLFSTADSLQTEMLQLDLQTLATGNYFVTVRTSSTQITKKFQVVR